MQTTDESGIKFGIDTNDLEKFYRQIFIKLGGSSIEVELEDEDYDVALDESLRTYRSLSENSSKFGYVFTTLSVGVQQYDLPKNIDDVRSIKRSRSGVYVGESFEPFSAGFIQNIFNPVGGTQIGTNLNLLTFELVSGYQELIGRMFGEYITFDFQQASGKLLIHRIPRTEEVVAVEVSVMRPLKELFADVQAYRWLRSYTEAELRIMLGEKYRKVSQQVSAQGGTTLKGNELVASGYELKEKLEQKIRDFEDGGDPVWPMIG